MPVLRFLTSLFALVALVALVADATPALQRHGSLQVDDGRRLLAGARPGLACGCALGSFAAPPRRGCGTPC